MPPAFVLSQDQTLRKYFTKRLSSSSSFINCSVASQKCKALDLISLGCLIFKELLAAALGDSSFIIPRLVSSVNSFFRFISNHSKLPTHTAGHYLAAFGDQRRCIIRSSVSIVKGYFAFLPIIFDVRWLVASG